MSYTIVPILQDEPLTFGAEHLPLDGAAGEAWKKAIQAIHPRLLPSLKENALIEEEESEFCTLGGIFEYIRGQELVLDGEQLKLSHCAEHFLDFLLTPAECLAIAEEKHAALGTLDHPAILTAIQDWWRQGYRVFLIQHS